MAYDYLGTMTRAQFDALRAFAEAAMEDVPAIADHLETMVDWQEGFCAKLAVAGHAAGGTQATGFAGATYTAIDREDGTVGEQRPVDGSLVAHLANRAPGRDGLVPGLSLSAGSLAGGDLPWIDTPIQPQPLNAWGAYDDLHTAAVVDAIKRAVLPQIRRTREDLEYRCKAAFDYREQLLMRVYDAGVNEQRLPAWLQQVDEQFASADPGRQIDDPQATVTPPDADGLLAERPTDSGGVRHTNLWADYPPTRLWPVWPLIEETEKGADALDRLDQEYEARLRAVEAGR